MHGALGDSGASSVVAHEYLQKSTYGSEHVTEHLIAQVIVWLCSRASQVHLICIYVH